MIKSELLKDKGVLIVSPVGPLAASDFERLAQEVDSYIEQNGRLHGLMVHAEFFPGWVDFAALLSHLGHAHATAPTCGHHRGPQLLVMRSP